MSICPNPSTPTHATMAHAHIYNINPPTKSPLWINHFIRQTCLYCGILMYEQGYHHLRQTQRIKIFHLIKRCYLNKKNRTVVTQFSCSSVIHCSIVMAFFSVSCSAFRAWNSNVPVIRKTHINRRLVQLMKVTADCRRNVRTVWERKSCKFLTAGCNKDNAQKHTHSCTHTFYQTHSFRNALWTFSEVCRYWKYMHSSRYIYSHALANVITSQHAYLLISANLYHKK